MIWRPSSLAKFIQPKQTKPQPNPSTTLWILRIIAVNIYRAAQENGPLGGSRSREIGIFKLLLRSCPEYLFCVFADYLE